MKKKTIIRVSIALLILAGAGRLAWVLLLSARSNKSDASPDKSFVLKVSSRWRDDFWFGAPHDCHVVRLITSDGRVLRRLVLDDRADGWPSSCAIQWKEDSSSVAISCTREELETARIVLPVSTRL